MSHPFENWIDIYRKNKNHLKQPPNHLYNTLYFNIWTRTSKWSTSEANTVNMSLLYSRSGLDLGKLSSVLAPRMATPIILVPDIGMLHEIEMDESSCTQSPFENTSSGVVVAL